MEALGQAQPADRLLLGHGESQRARQFVQCRRNGLVRRSDTGLMFARDQMWRTYRFRLRDASLPFRLLDFQYVPNLPYGSGVHQQGIVPSHLREKMR